MTERQIVALLKQGPQAWNDWRQQEPEAMPVVAHGEFGEALLVFCPVNFWH